MTIVGNEYHDANMERIEEIKENERTGKNRLITIDILDNAADHLVCKECVTEEIEGERTRCNEIITSRIAKK